MKFKKVLNEKIIIDNEVIFASVMNDNYWNDQKRRHYEV